MQTKSVKLWTGVENMVLKCVVDFIGCTVSSCIGDIVIMGWGETKGDVLC